ncbi:MAG: hypothetical protein H7246_21960 [Phycisphaerae bacterium]|nr:hypothetical protein [Saprospiraceae bacterium]
MTRTEVVNYADQKWNECTFHIIGLSLGTGLGSALPTPLIEIPKQIAISVSDLAMCFYIYKNYFGEDIKTSKQFSKLLERAGLVTVVGGGLVYVGYKAARGLLDECANLVPILGQIFSGVVTFTETMAIGFLWLHFVHKIYLNEKS